MNVKATVNVSQVRCDAFILKTKEPCAHVRAIVCAHACDCVCTCALNACARVFLCACMCVCVRACVRECVCSVVCARVYACLLSSKRSLCACTVYVTEWVRVRDWQKY